VRHCAIARPGNDAGIDRDRIAIDPGFGFGKTLEHNLALLRRLSELTELAIRYWRLSRKGMIVRSPARTGRARRGEPAAAIVAVQNGRGRPHARRRGNGGCIEGGIADHGDLT
jgi:dihydropteroate synthase